MSVPPPEGISSCPSCGARMDPDDRFCSTCGAARTRAAETPTVDDGALGTTDPEREIELRDALAPNYLLIRQLGVGGMGTVYLAREPALRRLVAVKVLAKELAADPTARARFAREAEAVAGVSHPNVVAIHGVGKLGDGTPYFIMQYVSGLSTAARLRQDGPFPVDDVKQILGDVASALAAAHRRGIIHRDIKPSNILHDEETGRALVSDFGIAAVRARGEHPEGTKLTQTGMAIGTPMYMSPEQLLAEEVTDRTDIYALGLTGYELLTNRGPFEVTSPQEIMAAHLRDTPVKLSTLRDDVDPEFERLLEACLQKDPTKRPSAEEVVRRLARGAPALLEWPPPGLEPLQGGVTRLTREWGAGSALVAVALLLMIRFAGTLPSALTSFATLVLWLAAIVGIMLIARATYSTVRTVRAVSAAFRLGYRTLTVAEVLADRRGDTGALIAGLREYATLDGAERSDLRRGRVRREGIALLASLTPLPAFLVLQWLAARGFAAPGIAPLVVFAPLLVAIPVVWRLARRERRALAPARAKLARGRQAADRTARLVAPWYESFERARRDQPLGAGPPGHPRVSWLALAVIVLAALGGAILSLPFALVGSFGPLLWGSYDLSSVEAKMRAAEIARPYAVPRDSSITPLDAGRAMYTLVRGGRPPETAFPERDPVSGIDFALFEGATPLGDLGNASESLWNRLPAGFSPDEARYLAQLDAWPGFREYSVVARAPLVDVVSARYVLPFPDSLGIWGLPIPRFVGTKNLAYASAARAAYLTSLGRYDDAETVLRETISFGFAMTEGPTLIEALVGIVIVGIGRLHLEQFYRASGQHAAAERLRAAYDSVIALNEEREVARAQLRADRAADPRAVRRDLLTWIADSSRVRGARWETLSWVAVAPCTNTRELLFGPDPDVTAAVTAARRGLVRTPGEAHLFTFMSRTPEHLVKALDREVRAFQGVPVRALYRMIRVGAALLGNPRLAGCAGVFLSGTYY